MLGIVSTALVVGLVFSIILVFINSGLLLYLANLLEFKDKKYGTALLIAIFIGLINFILSLIAIYVELYPILLQLAGIVVYTGITYVLITWRYEEDMKHRLMMTLLMALFSFTLSFVLMTVLSLVFNTLAIA